MKPRLGALLWLGMVTAVFADDGKLSEVLARLRQSGQASFQYRETRQLELASSPWQAQGVMLTDAAGTLVKLQLQPSRVIMAISGDSLYYWDAAQNQRHSMPISYADDAAAQILIFRSILQGRTQELQAGYDLAADIQDRHWSLHMQPKSGQAGENAPSIDISGDANPDKRQILIRQADGETTEYRIEKAAEQQSAAYTIPQLLQEAGGE
ncbi:LolA family protein [Methylomonas rivi]|uniref:Outer membrane lipoprotein carrier protein LolA n=1 Tax=Methylomonas rivi TaxID=2952226 RepID=A0ABT1U964_9GAMM|nr:outer membrane lipoprotein carrier protein LolA [Methylomonas sp. WSC-6]MCQ8130396.1 outer membrane lipoprotein carrier protein LolA [Methylomonas sp. WSC-6]